MLHLISVLDLTKYSEISLLVSQRGCRHQKLILAPPPLISSGKIHFTGNY